MDKILKGIGAILKAIGAKLETNKKGKWHQQNYITVQNI